MGCNSICSFGKLFPHICFGISTALFIIKDYSHAKERLAFLRLAHKISVSFSTCLLIQFTPEIWHPLVLKNISLIHQRMVQIKTRRHEQFQSTICEQSLVWSIHIQKRWVVDHLDKKIKQTALKTLCKFAASWERKLIRSSSPGCVSSTLIAAPTLLVDVTSPWDWCGCDAAAPCPGPDWRCFPQLCTQRVTEQAERLSNHW